MAYSVNTCQRCNKTAHELEKCGYCGVEKWICTRCIKSSHTGREKHRKIICKDCWSSAKKRNKYKSD